MRSPARRAQWLLRWYPRSWRLRHGEEFAALLEDSMAERRIWPGRLIDVAFQGLALRLRSLASTAVYFRGTLAGVVITASMVALGGWFGTARSVGIWTQGVNVAFMVPAGSSSVQISAIKDQLAEVPAVKQCAYLDEAQSYREALHVVGTQTLQVLFSQVSPKGQLPQ